MKELPLEVWSMIAQHLKKPSPPPPGEPANWNDHFNEHDLLSLQRVCQTTYRADCPILYSSPIVQNVGLFLEGVQNPLPTEDEALEDDLMGTLADYSIPYHKDVLINQVKKLYTIHASSRILAEGDDPTEKPDAEKLKDDEREGWKLAEKLLSQPPHHDDRVLVDFAMLKCIAFNSWDDGRWSAYEAKCTFYPEEKDCDCICGPEHVHERLYELLNPVFNMQDVTTCHSAPKTLGEQLRDGESTSSLQIYHRSPYVPSERGRHTRVYIRSDAITLPWLSEDEGDDEGDETITSDLSPHFPRRMEHDTDVDRAFRSNLELCFSSPATGEEEEVLKKVKETFERRNKAQAEKSNKSGLPAAKFQIRIGDEVTPCPACGART